jgi:hypothetical protein
MMVDIPFQPSIAYYRFGTPIDDASYVFDVRWNSREQAWYFDILEANLTPILYGTKIVLGTYLGRRCEHRLFNRGVFVAIDTTDKGREAAFDDLGTRVLVRYIPTDDLLVLLSA